MPNWSVKESSIVPVVGDGAISSPDFGDGRFIPVLIVDCSNHQELSDLIMLHSEEAPGDVTTIWGRRLLSKKFVFLEMAFSKPMRTTITLQFSVEKQGDIVEWIRKVRGVYLQPTCSGRRVIEGINKEKILVEVPKESTFPGWERIHTDSLVKKYRRSGLGRAQAVRAAETHRRTLEELWFRRSIPQ